jgi:hypothetical protein
MMSRCNGDANKYYGGRGIRVCDEWQDFTAFRDWALANGYRDDLTIERRDFNGNYSPENCTWVPLSEQSKNRRSLRLITFKGETQYESEWCRRLGVAPCTIARRLKAGWPLELALTVPKMRRKRGQSRDLDRSADKSA